MSIVEVNKSERKNLTAIVNRIDLLPLQEPIGLTNR